MAATTVSYGRIARFTSQAGKKIVAVFEQPTVVRITHWISAITIPILIASGIQVFFVFPSFGPKIPQHNLMGVTPGFHPLSVGSWFHALSFGRWLAGAEQVALHLHVGLYRCRRCVRYLRNRVRPLQNCVLCATGHPRRLADG